jgi:3-hydroxyisobutyrate dehydrogenase-like beta-hydroxyacid dehydrogenase
MPTIAIIGAGAMGSAVGARLAEQGAKVLTILDGRSDATRKRAAEAGMEAVGIDALIKAEIILSIVPPSEAIATAKLVADAVTRSSARAVFVDCNAISPKTMTDVAAAFDTNAVEVLDGSIIGPPPKAGSKGTKFYVAGDGANRTGILADHGLEVRRIDGPLGASSALKMCYGGINKGVIGLGTAMLLAAIDAGADQSLKRELEESVPEIDRKLVGGLPDMYAKAYRWVAEMEEIAEFLGKDDPASLIFKGMAGVYARMAEDRSSSAELAAALNKVLGRD